MKLPYLIIVNGKSSLNGERFAIRIHGETEITGSGLTIYDVVHALADHAQEEAARMEYPDSIQITLHPAAKEASR